MDDAGVGRHHREVAKRRLPPAQERVTLFVARKFDRRVQRQRLRLAVFVDLDRVIDDQLGRHQRVDPLSVATQFLDRCAHGREIDHRRDTGEILQENARRHEGDLVARLGLRVPAAERADVGLFDRLAVFVAQQVLEQDAQRERQPRRLKARLFEGRETVNFERALSDVEGAATTEAVGHDGPFLVAGRAMSRAESTALNGASGQERKMCFRTLRGVVSPGGGLSFSMR